MDQDHVQELIMAAHAEVDRDRAILHRAALTETLPFLRNRTNEGPGGGHSPHGGGSEHGPLGVEEPLSKLAQVNDLEKAMERKLVRRAALVDPALVGGAYGAGGDGPWKPRISHINNKTLKSMTLRDPIVSAIIQTRVAQVSNFSRPQTNRYETGFKWEPRDSSLKIRKGSEEEIEVKWLCDYITNCGLTTDRFREEKLTFIDWLKCLVRDRYTFGYACIETVPDYMGRIHHFLNAPTEAIYFANPRYDRNVLNSLGQINWANNDNGIGSEYERRVAEQARTNSHQVDEDVDFVEVNNGQVVSTFTHDEIIFAKGNVQNFIDQNGYPIGETELCTTTITTHLQSLQYNKSYFCINENSLIRTRDGQFRIIDLYRRYRDEAIDIWTGRTYHRGRVYKTQSLKNCRTILKSGQILQTSDEHWFYRVRDDQNSPEFINQRDLRPGDYVMVSPDGYDGEDSCPRGIYPNKYHPSDSRYRHWDSSEVEDDLFEVLGWIAGDGHIGRLDDCGRETAVQLFYHHVKEKHILERHAAILGKYGINFKIVNRPLSGRNREKYGDGDRPRIMIHDVCFKRWMLDLGFGRATDKGIPYRLFSMSRKYRESFIRGIFSADGHCRIHRGGYGVPELACALENIRSGVASLLISLGIGSSLIYRKGHPIGLRVLDIDRFKKIGFIQDYKNRFTPRDSRNQKSHDSLPPGISLEIARSLASVMRHNDRGYGNVRRIISAGGRLSRSTAVKLCRQFNITRYDDLLGFRYVKVVGVENTGQIVQMYDIEIFDSIHRFTVDGVVVHNTHGFAARGVVHVKGDIDRKQIDLFRYQWYNQIAGNANSWRTPIITGVDEVNWIPLSATNRDMEYTQYVDHMIRTICGIFQISPMEFGFDYLDRGAGSQTLGESKNEWKVQESKERGLKPLLMWIEDIINQYIMPRADNRLSEKYVFRFVGLDAESKEEELQRQEQAIQLHSSLNDIRSEIEKEPVVGGGFILNPLFVDIVKTYCTAAEIREWFMGIPGAINDPAWQYCEGPGWLAWNQMQMQMQMQQEQMAMMAGQPAQTESGAEPGQRNLDTVLDDYFAAQGDESVQKTYLDRFDLRKAVRPIRKPTPMAFPIDRTNRRYDKIREHYLKASGDVQRKMLARVQQVIAGMAETDDRQVASVGMVRTNGSDARTDGRTSRVNGSEGRLNGRQGRD